MTVTIKSAHIGNYYIEISQDKYENAYKVTADEKRGGQFYPVNENTYPDIKKANARFNYLVRKATRNEF